MNIQQQTTIYNPGYNTLTNNNGTIRGQSVNALDLSLIPSLPTLPAITPGTQNLSVAQKKSLTITPGDYGTLTVGQQATIILSGGIYTFRDWSISQKAQITFQAASVIHIAGRLNLADEVAVGPATTSPTLTANSIIFYVAGKNGNNGGINESPKSVAIGQKGTVKANLLAPNGTIHFDQGVKVTGAFIGRWVNASQQAQFTLDSAFGLNGSSSSGPETPSAEEPQPTLPTQWTHTLALPLVITSVGETTTRVEASVKAVEETIEESAEEVINPEVSAEIQLFFPAITP